MEENKEDLAQRSAVIPSILTDTPQFPNVINCDFEYFARLRAEMVKALTQLKGDASTQYDNIMKLTTVPDPVLCVLGDFLYKEPIKITRGIPKGSSFAFTIYLNNQLLELYKTGLQCIKVVDFSTDSASISKRIENFLTYSNTFLGTIQLYSYGVSAYVPKHVRLKILPQPPISCHAVICYHSFDTLCVHEHKSQVFFGYVKKGARSMIVTFDAFKASRLDIETASASHISAYDFRVYWKNNHVIKYSLYGQQYLDTKFSDKKIYAICRKHDVVPRFLSYSKVGKVCPVIGKVQKKLRETTRRNGIISKYTRIITLFKLEDPGCCNNENEYTFKFVRSSRSDHEPITVIQPVPLNMYTFRSLRVSPVCYGPKIDGFQAVLYLYTMRGSSHNLYLVLRNGCVFATTYEYMGSPVVLQVTVCGNVSIVQGDSFFVKNIWVEDVVKLGKYVSPKMDFYYRQRFYSSWQSESTALSRFKVKTWKIYNDEKIQFERRNIDIEGTIFQGVNVYRFRDGSQKRICLSHHYTTTSCVFVKDKYTVDLDVQNGIVYFLGSKHEVSEKNGISEYYVEGTKLGAFVRGRPDKNDPNNLSVQEDLSRSISEEMFNSLVLNVEEVEIDPLQKFPMIFKKFMAGDVMDKLDPEEIRQLMLSGITKLCNYSCTDEQISSFYEWRYEYISYTIKRSVASSGVIIPPEKDFVVQDLSEIAKYYSSEY